MTKLPRRLFEFSHEQYQQALWHCGGYWNTKLFLNFANYMATDKVYELADKLETATALNPNAAKVEWLGWDPDDSNVEKRG